MIADANINGHPSPAGDNGRDSAGRFAAGNKAGKGNPHHMAVQQFRTAMYEAITAGNVRAVVLKLVEKAEAGEEWAIKELLDRAVGKPTQVTPSDGGHMGYIKFIAMPEDEVLGRK